MPANQQPQKSSAVTTAAGSSRRRHILMLILIGSAISFVLYRHGAQLWYAPLAFVLVHLPLFGGLAFVSVLLNRNQGHTQSHGGQLVHRPRLYDRVVGVLTLGRERKFRQWTLNLGVLKNSDSVLDVGCGTGSLLLEAAECLGSSANLHGIEPSPEMASHARRKAESSAVSLEVVEGSADSLPYSDASFDVIFCTLVLHHLPESMRENAVREMRRVLRADGRLVLVDVQKPKSYMGVISLVSLLHGQSSRNSNLLDIKPLLEELGFTNIARHSRSGGAIGAIVGFLDPKEHTIEKSTLDG